jgi:hypothetical protein
MTGVAGTPWYTNMYFANTPGTTQQAIDNVDAFWETLKAQINNFVTGTVEGDVALVDDVTGLITGVETGVAGTIDMSGVGNCLPTSTQGLVNLNTGFYVAGRQLRGKLYIPGLITSSADGAGDPAAAFKTAWVSACTALRSAASTTGVWKVWSKTHGVSDAIESFTVKPQFAVLRSRRD